MMDEWHRLTIDMEYDMPWENQPKITINGNVSLDQHLEIVEKEEQLKQDVYKRKEIIQETFGQIPMVKGSIYFKPRKVGTPVTKVLNSKIYEIRDQIGYLLTRSGNNEAYALFLSFNNRKQRQIEKLLKLFRKLKDKKFRFVDAVKTLEDSEFPDPHRYLLMLQQAEVLTRHDNKGYVLYSKVCMTEYDALVSIINNANKLIGYVTYVKKPPVSNIKTKLINKPIVSTYKPVVNPQIMSILSDLVNGYNGENLESYVDAFLKELKSKQIL